MNARTPAESRTTLSEASKSMRYLSVPNRDCRPRFDAKNRLSALLDRVERGEDCHYPARQVRRPPRSGRPGVRPREGPTSRRRHYRGEPWRYFGRDQDKRSHQRRPQLTFVLDNSVALTWCFETSEPPRRPLCCSGLGIP